MKDEHIQAIKAIVEQYEVSPLDPSPLEYYPLVTYAYMLSGDSKGNIYLVDESGLKIDQDQATRIIKACLSSLDFTPKTRRAMKLLIEDRKRDIEKSEKRKRSCHSEGYIYLASASDLNLWKIGLSKRPRERGESLKKQSPVPVYIEYLFFVMDMKSTEKKLHEMFAHKNTHGEWFELSDEDIKLVEKVCNDDGWDD